jgi:predicted DCC family thiol-disulfide oxidoreductase YuxK
MLRIFKKLSKLWPLLYAFIIFPPALRDFFYTRFASHRYRWFGVSESCMMPTPAMQARF